MAVEFEPPAAEQTEAEKLSDRFETAIGQLTDDFARIVLHIAAHPRHNEKLERARELLGTLQSAADNVRSYVDAIEARTVTMDLSLLVGLLEAAALRATELANENAVKPGSIAAQRAP
jgi:hypothetical protein